MRSDLVDTLAERLLRAREDGRPLDVPDGVDEPTVEEAYAVQDAVVRRLGGVGGWKVGAASPTAEPRCVPLPAPQVFRGPVRLAAEAYGRLGIEAEVGFRMATALPARATPYTRNEVIAAVGAVHPVIEVVDSRWRAWPQIGAGWALADHSANGALVYGHGLQAWHEFDLSIQPIRLEIDGQEPADAVGGNAAGDPVSLLVWLANHAAARCGGLKAGDVVTTGSCTGMSFATPGAGVRVDLKGIGDVSLRLEA